MKQPVLLLSRNQDGAAGEPMAEINTTPLIDVMLVLLIMLIITIPPRQHAVPTQLPTARSALPSELPTVEVEIDAKNRILWNRFPLANFAELNAKLAEARAQVPLPILRLRADPRCSYDVFAQVLSFTQSQGLQLGLETP